MKESRIRKMRKCRREGCGREAHETAEELREHDMEHRRIARLAAAGLVMPTLHDISTAVGSRVL